MIRILVFLAVLFLGFPVGAQTARETLKDDREVDAINLTEAELDILIDELKIQMENASQADREAFTARRMEQILIDNPQLKTDLMNE